VFLPVVEADIKRFGGVGEFLKGRAPGGEAVGHGSHESNIVRAILALFFAITTARAIPAFQGVFQLHDSIVVHCRLQAWPVLFLIDRQAQVRLEQRDSRVDVIGDLVGRRARLLFRLRGWRFVASLSERTIDLGRANQCGGRQADNQF